ncbi:MAG: G5 domain-containing protein [Oscillospiraceae bacterium]|jgi:uncharacterized protein YabE (DUF348 family)|nr:G5 domain-containing protein [Oscillospiraceae bacterium]
MEDQILHGRKRRMMLLSLLLVAVMAVVVPVTAFAMNARTVTLTDDGVTTVFQSTREDVYDILRSQDIVLSNDDFLDLEGFSAEAEAAIVIHRAKRVILIDDGVEERLTAAGSVARLLSLSNTVLGERDTINASLDTPLTNDMVIIIKRAFDVAVVDDGETRSLSLTEGTVEMALSEAGILLVGEDFVEPELKTILEPGMTIHVMRVRYGDRKAVTAIPYGRVQKKDASHTLGWSKIEQAGVNGKKESVYRDKYINGVRVESVLLTETVLEQPVNEIKIVGTKVVRLQPGLTPISQLTQPKEVKVVNGVPTAYKQVITGLATAYTADTRTSTGIKPRPGHVAVNPNQIPYGSQLYIVSNDGKYVYGYAIAADTGGFAKQGRITVDLFMENNTQCGQWGVRGVTIYVLDLPRVKP